MKNQALRTVAAAVAPCSERPMQALAPDDCGGYVEPMHLPGHEDGPPEAQNPYREAALTAWRMLARAKVQVEAAIIALEDESPSRALDLLMATRSWSDFEDPRKS